MDSRQIYRGMDIGTDKVSPDDRARVPHHGLDLVGPEERYSAGRFAREARGWIEAIRGRGHLPLLVGGTGFFLKALAEPIFREPPLDPARREALEGWLGALEAERLATWVEVLDPERAPVARAGGPQRMIRTAEVALLTGRPLSWWHRNAPAEAPPVPVRVVELVIPPEERARRIDARARRMFDRGLLSEVDRLLREGADPDDPGMTGTGYREAADVLLGRATVEEAIDRVQRATRAYARRQVTWFRHQLPPDRLRLDALLPQADQVEAVLRWWGSAPVEGSGALPSPSSPP